MSKRARPDGDRSGDDVPTKQRNGSEPSVRNRSEFRMLFEEQTKPAVGTPSADAKGRPPVLNDEQLSNAADRLRERLGRIPKIDELIAEAGGCQRQRASRTLQTMRQQAAAKSIKVAIVLPPELESEMRVWIDRWRLLAADQLAAKHAELEERHEAERAADQALITDLQIAMHELREKHADQVRLATELLAANRQIEEKALQLRMERDIARALADDRLKIIASFATTAA